MATNPTSPTAAFGELQRALLAAHARGDTYALIGLYAEAGTLALNQGDIDAGCFFLTHARVYALEAADPREAALRSVLQAHHREA